MLGHSFIHAVVLALACVVPQTEQQEIEVGDIVRITRPGNQRRSTGRDDDVPSPRNNRGSTEPFEATVTEISKDGKVSYLSQQFTATSRRRRTGTTSLKNVELVRKRARPKNEFRIWKSTAGTKEVEAKLVKIDGKKIVLETRDGKKFDYAIDKLTEADQQYLSLDTSIERRMVTDNPIIPFGKKPRKLGTKSWKFIAQPVVAYAEPTTALAFAVPAPIEIDWMGRLGDRAASGSFGVPAGGAGSRRSNFGSGRGSGGSRRGNRPTDAPGGLGRGAGSPRMSRGNTLLSEVKISADGKQCFIVSNHGSEQRGTVMGIDLESGTPVFEEEIDGFVLGISDDGSLVSLIQTGLGDQRGEMIIKEPGIGGRVWHRFPMRSQMEFSGYKIKSAFFTSNSQLITVGEEIVAMDFASRKGYATTRFPLMALVTGVASSPDKSHIAIGSTAGIMVFDTKRGKSVGGIAIEDGFFIDQMVFSPDGLKLAVYNRPNVNIYDLKSGAFVDSFSHRVKAPDSRMSWPHQNLMVFGNKDVVDLGLKTKVWHLDNDAQIKGGIVHMSDSWYLYLDGGREMLPVKLPFEEVASKVASLDGESLTAFKPGETFSLDLNLPFGDQEIEKIRQSLMDSLTEKGFVHDPNSKNVFFCFFEEGNEEDAKVNVAKYRSDPKLIDITWTPTTSFIELEKDGEFVWGTRSENGISRTVYLKENEDPQSAATRMAAPKVQQFLGTNLPNRFIVFPEGQKYLGSTMITTGGVESSN